MNLSCFVAQFLSTPKDLLLFSAAGNFYICWTHPLLIIRMPPSSTCVERGGNCVVERLVHNRRRSSFSQPERPRNVFSAPRPLAPSDADKTKTFFSSPVHHEREKERERLYTSTDASSSGKEENKKEINDKKIKKQNKTRR